MITNNTMKKILNDFSIVDEIEKIKLEPMLASILARGIVKINECYFLEELMPQDFDYDEAAKSVHDLTEIESDINHIHIGDFIVQSEVCVQNTIKQGMRYALKLNKILPGNEKFKIILSCTIDPIFDCNVRFHKQRTGENWIAVDLEKYEEGVMVWE